MSREVPCPYCDTPCECDMVDVGFGESNGVQCGPYFCENCGASEIGPEKYHEEYDKDFRLIKMEPSKAFLALSALEQECGWYAQGKPVSPYANTYNGELVDHKTALDLYRCGLLDEKKK